MASCDEDIYMEKCMNSKFIQYQHNLRRPTSRPVDTDVFWADYQKYGFEFAVKKYADYSCRGKIKHIIKKMLAGLGLRK